MMNRNVVVGLMLSAVSFVVAQEPTLAPYNYNFIASCPEGCRDIDAVASCGSLAAMLNCEMGVNGDVNLTCADGSNYYLGALGCNNFSPDGPSQFHTTTILPASLAVVESDISWLGALVRRAFAYSVALVSPTSTTGIATAAGFAMLLASAVLVAHAAVPRAVGFVAGAVLGLCASIIVMAACRQQISYQQWYTIAVCAAIALIAGAISAYSLLLRGLCCGFGSGTLMCTTVLGVSANFVDGAVSDWTVGVATVVVVVNALISLRFRSAAELEFVVFFGVFTLTVASVPFVSSVASSPLPCRSVVAFRSCSIAQIGVPVGVGLGLLVVGRCVAARLRHSAVRDELNRGAIENGSDLSLQARANYNRGYGAANEW